jgi:formylglycine-generating enzyme
MATCCTPADGTPKNRHSDEAPYSPAPLTRFLTSGNKDMILLDGGVFLMGADDAVGFTEDGEGPVREVTLSPFYIDKSVVSNARFQQFVAATGYRTEAERFGWSYVFKNYVPKILVKRGRARRVPGLDWWLGVEGANWNHPEGPGSDIRNRNEHPVVHISWTDATAFCEWARARLPTEAEWEYAARGGLVQKRYAWGDDLTPNGKHMCNIWQGRFPDYDSAEDGFAGTSPVTAFPSNEYGLYGVAGNVWEWCADWFSPRHRRRSAGSDPAGPATGAARVMRGGSHLCHSSYCNRYRVAARTSNTPDSSTTNLGFRCVRSGVRSA